MSIGLALSPRRRLAAAGVVVAVLAVLVIGSFVVLGGETENGTSERTTTGDPADAGAGGPAAAPPGASAVSPPELKTTGEDWDQIVRSIVAYRHWIYAHNPDPELIARIEVPSYEGFADDQLGLRNIMTKGWRYDPPRQPLPVELVRLHRRSADNVARVFIRFGPAPPLRVVDPQGNVIQDVPEQPANAIVWTLVREPAEDPHWRLLKVTPFTDEPGPPPA